MNAVKKIITILTLPLIASVVISCCDCLTPTIFGSYSNCGLSVLSLDNSGATPVVTTTNQIPKRAYGLRISIEQSENKCVSKIYPSFFISSAYAFGCDCPPSHKYSPLEVIESIKISTLNDFDANHLKNKDVSAYFFEKQAGSFTKIDNYVKKLKDQSILFKNSRWSSYDNSTTFDLLLMTAPTIGTEHQFEVTITLSDKRVLNAKTELVNLK